MRRTGQWSTKQTDAFETAGGVARARMRSASAVLLVVCGLTRLGTKSGIQIDDQAHSTPTVSRERQRDQCTK